MKLLVIWMLVASLSVAFSETMIGNCNRTFFGYGAAVCQRGAVDNLVLVNDSTCESAYNVQISCLNRHVKACLTGNPLLETFSPSVVDLFKYVVMNCGSVNGLVNDFLLNLLKCPAAKPSFIQAKDCWTEFSSKVKANKRDPNLCSVYRKAKKCVTDKINAACPEIKLEHDHCNPFCANGTDDHRTCPVMRISLTCERELYFEKEKVCERKFIEGLTRSDSSSCSTELPKLALCVKDQYRGCFFPRVDNALLEKLEDAVVKTSSAQRLFCNATSLKVDGLSAPLRDIIACNADFYKNAENCVTDFREAYSTKKDNVTLCRKFDSAKSCLYEVRKTHCQHSPALLQMVNNTHNPFNCEDKPNPTSRSELVLSSVWLVLTISTTLLSISTFLSG